MPPVGYGPKIPASERLETHALDRNATEISIIHRILDSNSYSPALKFLTSIIAPLKNTLQNPNIGPSSAIYENKTLLLLTYSNTLNYK